MADELIDPFVDNKVGRQDKAHPIPQDLDIRDNFRRENLPLYLDAQTTSEIVPAPGPSTQAVADGVAGPYDLSALEDLKVVVDDYEGRNTKAAAKGMTSSGSGPGTDTVSGASDQAGLSLHGEAAQQVILGATLTDGDAIAAAIQVAVRALTAASAENQEAYDGFLAEYVAPSFSTALAVQLDSGVAVQELVLDSVRGLNRGDVLEIADQAGGPLAPFEAKVIDIFRARKAVRVQLVAAGVITEDVEVGALVRKRDDYYKFTSGKGGSDSLVVWSIGGANDMAVALKLDAASGAAEGSGLDAVGVQSFRFEAGDFVDPAAATAAEVALVMNKSLTGAIAADAAGTLRLTSRKFGESANIYALDEGSNSAIGLPLRDAIEQGTQSDIVLSMAGVDILQIQAVSAAGVPGNYKDLASIAYRVEGDKLVNADGTDYAADDTWRVTHSPRRL